MGLEEQGDSGHQRNDGHRLGIGQTSLPRPRAVSSQTLPVAVRNEARQDLGPKARQDLGPRPWWLILGLSRSRLLHLHTPPSLQSCSKCFLQLTGRRRAVTTLCDLTVKTGLLTLVGNLRCGVN